MATASKLGQSAGVAVAVVYDVSIQATVVTASATVDAGKGFATGFRAELARRRSARKPKLLTYKR